MRRHYLLVVLLLFVTTRCSRSFSLLPVLPRTTTNSITAGSTRTCPQCYGWVQRDGDDGEWEWEEDDPNYVPSAATATTTATATTATDTITATGSTPKLPSGSYKPKQSLGQNYLKDPNTVAKIIRAFHSDATTTKNNNNNDTDTKIIHNVIELGPGAGALTDTLVDKYGYDVFQCIEIDERSVTLLKEKHHQRLRIIHDDVLQINYSNIMNESNEGQYPLNVIGNLPYYITSQILFAFADAAHVGAISSATVTMQYEVAKRIVATPTQNKDYGILSVVFQIYCSNVNLHFKIPPTVFYPKPKVDSALVGLHFLTPNQLRRRLGDGVQPKQLRKVITTSFQQRRKTLRNSLKKLVVREICNNGDNTEAARAIFNSVPLPLSESVLKAQNDGDDTFSQTQQLPNDWSSKRPEQLTPGQFIELTRLLYSFSSSTTSNNSNNDTNDSTTAEYPLGNKVWRKLKHGK